MISYMDLQANSYGWFENHCSCEFAFGVFGQMINLDILFEMEF